MARKIVVPEHSALQRVRSLSDLGLAVRAARTKDDLRIDTAAGLCSVSVGLLSGLENGSRVVKLDKLLTVLDGLGLEMLVTTKKVAERLEQEVIGG